MTRASAEHSPRNFTTSHGNRAPAPLRGEIAVPSDKSITHRGLLFSALAHGDGVVRATSPGRDNLQTLRVLRALGVEIQASLPRALVPIARAEEIEVSEHDSLEARFSIVGRGVEGFRTPSQALYCGNSGTTARLLTGVLAACPFTATLTGDESLSRRPFKRVAEPLTQMGAQFAGDTLPLAIRGGRLRGIEYFSAKASAQVKSAILLAGLHTAEHVVVLEPVQSRDHTERLFAGMGVQVEQGEDSEGKWRVSLPKKRRLSAVEISVPGDFSAAAFFLVASTVIPSSHLVLRNVSCNPTRLGLLHVLTRMGASINATGERLEGGEPLCDFVCDARSLKGVTVGSEDVVRAIDEVPILLVAAACAEGVSEIRGAEELRVKESDRLRMMATLLTDFGVKVEELPDGMIVHGDPSLVGSRRSAPPRPAPWDFTGDHRISMCGAVLEYIVRGEYSLFDPAAVETSFPTFLDCWKVSTAHVEGRIEER